MTAVLSALPAALAGLRWRYMGRSLPLFVLLAWVWLSDLARAIIAVPTAWQGWVMTDLLLVSWYVAHVLVVRRDRVALHLAGATAGATAAMTLRYLDHWRAMEVYHWRFGWFSGAGLAWSAWGFLEWSRHATGVCRAVGMLSAGLSVIQVLNLDSVMGYNVGPIVGYIAASLLMIYDLTPLIKRRIQ